MLNTLIGLGHWQILGLVVYLLWQGAVIPSMPEEVMVPTLGILWSQGRVGFLECVFAVQLGIMGGDLVLLSLGRFIGPQLLSRRPFSLIAGPESIEEASAKLRKNGSWLIFLTRFTPMVRAPIFFAAGVSKMSPLKFLRSDYLASWLFIPLLLIAGKTLGANSSSLLGAFKVLGSVMGTFLLCGIAFAYVRERGRTQKKSLLTATLLATGILEECLEEHLEERLPKTAE
jgi:membrane protein DedA with SNARE-associated domain